LFHIAERKEATLKVIEKLAISKEEGQDRGE
jgi:hypothetical protein